MGRFKKYYYLLRVQQWVKNVFVFAPLLFSPLLAISNHVYNTICVFVLFCIGSSSVYIFNDICDAKKDSLHCIKRKIRPIASGDISTPNALSIMFFLYLLLGFSAYYLPQIVLIIAGYILLNIFYSLYFKSIAVLDVFCVGVGFVLRVYSGSVAISVTLSSWMLIATFSLAIFLACSKRYHEHLFMGEVLPVTNQQYYSLDMLRFFSIISASATLMFYSFFVMVQRNVLSLTIPLVMFGLFRYCYILGLQGQGYSPTDRVSKDPSIIVVSILWVCLCAYLLHHR